MAIKSSPIVVVCGASAGVGRAVAQRFGRGGWNVALLARGLDGLEAARREIEGMGALALAIPLDVADPEQVENAAARIERELGAIDVWVNNAMVTIFCEVVDIAAADFRRSTEVTYLGTVWGTQAALRRMLPRNRGHIIQVGSALAYRSIPLQSVYCGAKSAIRGFTDSLRCELIHHHSAVQLTMVQLSSFNTPQFDWARSCQKLKAQPVPPIFQPELAAEGVWWAAHHRRRELWVGAPAAQAILGNRVIAGLLDRFLARKGYSGQLSDQAERPGRTDNLYTPLPGDHGAHGRFDEVARGSSPELWITTHRPLVAVGIAAAALAVALALWT